MLPSSSPTNENNMVDRHFSRRYLFSNVAYVVWLFVPSLFLVYLTIEPIGTNTYYFAPRSTLHTPHLFSPTPAVAARGCGAARAVITPLLVIGGGGRDVAPPPTPQPPTPPSAPSSCVHTPYMSPILQASIPLMCHEADIIMTLCDGTNCDYVSEARYMLSIASKVSHTS